MHLHRSILSPVVPGGLAINNKLLNIVGAPFIAPFMLAADLKGRNKLRPYKTNCQNNRIVE
jgi:hypothetical protein